MSTLNERTNPVFIFRTMDKQKCLIKGTEENIKFINNIVQYINIVILSSKTLN